MGRKLLAIWRPLEPEALEKTPWRPTFCPLKATIRQCLVARITSLLPRHIVHFETFSLCVFDPEEKAREHQIMSCHCVQSAQISATFFRALVFNSSSWPNKCPFRRLPRLRHPQHAERRPEQFLTSPAPSCAGTMSPSIGACFLNSTLFSFHLLLVQLELLVQGPHPTLHDLCQLSFVASHCILKVTPESVVFLSKRFHASSAILRMFETW